MANRRRKIKKLNTFLLALIFMGGTFWTLCLYMTPNIINILSLKFVRPVSTSFMRYNSFSYPFERIKYNWVDADQISNYLKSAVVIAEDDRFYRHHGLDWEAIKRAARVNWERKSLKFGASTITQQLVKNLYLTPSKDPIRKFREMFIALFLDSYLSKDRILELYLNVVEWGPNVYGAQAASKHYFGGSAKGIGPSQSAFLASILPNPVQYGRRGYHLSNRGFSILNRIQ